MDTLLDHLHKWEAAKKDAVLYRFVDADCRDLEQYTFGEFAERTRELAAYLHFEAGLRPGQRALLVYPPGLEMIAAFIACARIGVIAVPVAAPLPMAFDAGLAKLNFIAQDCRASAVLSTKQFGYDYQALLNGMPGDVNGPDLPWYGTDASQSYGGDQVPDTPGDVLFLQYTSGSTNDPKGVTVSHENVIANSGAFSEDVILASWLPQHHDMGLISAYLYPIVLGCTTHGMSPLDFLAKPSAWLRLITQERASHSPCPNFALEYCLREDKLPDSELEGIDLSSLVSLTAGAEPLRAKTFERFRNRFAPYGLKPTTLSGAYGMAENTLIVSWNGRHTLTVNKRALENNVARVERGETANQTHLVSCGKPDVGNVVKVVRDEVALPDGQVGELWVDGPSKSVGYWGRPELSTETFGARLPADHRRYLRTGDLGFIYEGELYVCGRTKDLIIVRGVNCYPSDVEAIVERAAPQVRHGCVAAFSVDQDDEETLVVVAEVRSEHDLPEGSAVAREIRRHGHVDPHTIVFVPPKSIPKTTSGKIQRSATRTLWRDGELTVWGSYLHHERPDVSAGPLARFQHLIHSYDLTGEEDCSFADLGIDSLALAELNTDLQALLIEHGAADLVGEVDTRLLQRLTVAEFFDLMKRFGNQRRWQPGWVRRRGARALRRVLDEMAVSYRLGDDGKMRADAKLPLPQLPAWPPGEINNILLTGATGFLGPFLLNSLLRKTASTIHVLVRAADAEHGRDRIMAGLRHAQLWTPELETVMADRLRVICGDLTQPHLGIAGRASGTAGGEAAWLRLAERMDAIVHNGALVNYVRTYDALRPANVEATRELLRLAMTYKQKMFHLVSSTFIYGWSTEPEIFEWDANEKMSGLDFGYSQSKWVAEQLVLAAERKGLPVRIYRPSLISPTADGHGSADDILVRLTAFMIEHGLAVNATNQLSLLPADLIADHVVELMQLPREAGSVFNMTADDYYNLPDLTEMLTTDHGFRFDYHDIGSFVDQVKKRCTPRDPLYPLVDFLCRSASKIEAMHAKRYNNEQYQQARTLAGVNIHEPALHETVNSLVGFMRGNNLIAEEGQRVWF